MNGVLRLTELADGIISDVGKPHRDFVLLEKKHTCMTMIERDFRFLDRGFGGNKSSNKGSSFVNIDTCRFPQGIRFVLNPHPQTVQYL
jgi:hypothetical protein